MPGHVSVARQQVLANVERRHVSGQFTAPVTGRRPPNVIRSERGEKPRRREMAREGDEDELAAVVVDARRSRVEPEEEVASVMPGRLNRGARVAVRS